MDFLISSDVFEHVAPPISRAFTNARKLLKRNGKFILSVPYTLEEDTQEYFPDLYDYEIINRDGRQVLLNRTRDHRLEEFSDLVFHGGEGETLAMRTFSKNGLLANLREAGFADVRIMTEPCLPFGIYWPYQKSLPVIAKLNA